jgi:IS5 family transposase
VELVRTLKVTRGSKLRVDSTVVETNVHHPTDSRLLGDGVKVISRLLRRAKKVLPVEVAEGLGKDVLRTRHRSVRRISQKLHRMALRKVEKAKEELQDTYRKLSAVAKASRAQAVKVEEVLRKQTDPRTRGLAALGALRGAPRAGRRSGGPSRPTRGTSASDREDLEPL